MHKPRNNDNEILMRLQSAALAGNDAAWSELWAKSLLVCKRIAVSEIQKNGLFSYSDDDVDDIAANCVCKVIARFAKRKNYCAKKNFVSVLYLAVISAIYHQRKCDILLKNFYAELNANKKYYAVDFS